MKIVVVSTPIFKLGAAGLAGYGGLEQIAWECARGLARKGHRVSLVAPDGSECPGVEVIHCGPAGQTDEKAAYDRYWKHLLHTDCVVSHDWNKFAYMLKLEGRMTAPILCVCHAVIPGMFQTPPPVPKPCVVCISQDQADHFGALHGKYQSRVCRNGINLDFYKPTGIPRTDRFLFLARFCVEKGPDIALDVCKRVGVGLDLIGDTQITGQPEYYHKCMAMADGKQLRVVGGVPRPEAVHWYSRAHAFLHPNERFREPLGLAPVEAMACGLPCVAWRYGAMKETVKHGETGLLVDSVQEFEAAVRSLAGGVSDETRRRCREWAGQFSLDAMVNRYDELVHEAVSTGGW